MELAGSLHFLLGWLLTLRRHPRRLRVGPAFDELPGVVEGDGGHPF
jgi:hypothetical protein